MIRVLVAEDSLVTQQWLVRILERDPEITVIGTVENGEDAVRFVEAGKPDIITMDLHMPKMDGIEATRRIMETHPVPIVVVSSLWSREESATTFRAIEAGALAFVPTPRAGSSADCEIEARNLVQTVKAMAEVKVVRRWGRRHEGAAAPLSAGGASKRAVSREIQFVAVGISTGGPTVLRTFLKNFPKDFPPILIVQHIVAGFLDGLVEWLNGSGCTVAVAEHGLRPKPGVAYLAPDGVHMGIDSLGMIVLSDGPSENGMRPSVSYLFRSLAQNFGPRAAGVLLTGMGRDGALELKLMREAGAVTFAQDRESSAVHGMPGAAIAIGAAVHILPPEKIATALVDLVQGRTT